MSDDETFLTSTQVRARYGGKSRMWLYRTLRDRADFPKPVPMGGGRYWRLGDLREYEKRCAAQAKSNDSSETSPSTSHKGASGEQKEKGPAVGSASPRGNKNQPEEAGSYRSPARP